MERVSVRRHIQQILHCAQEALSVVENEEENFLALEDLEHAEMLVSEVLKRLRSR